MSRILCLCLCFLALSACSRTSFVYNQLDWLLPWYVEDYTSLDRDQERYLDELLTPFLNWHRSTELPCYIDLIDHIEASTSREASAEDIAIIAESLERAWLRTQDETLDWLLDLGGQLSDEQIQAFLEELEEQQRKAEEKYLDRSDEEFYSDNYKIMREIAEDYLGKLQQPQREELSLVSKSLRRSDAAWLKERAAFQQQLAVVLKREAGWEQRVRDLVASRLDHAPEEYQEIVEHNVAAINDWVADLMNSRTDKQDAHLQNRLQKLRTDLQGLVSQTEHASSCEADLIAAERV